MTAADKIAEARVLIEPLSVQRLLVNGRLEDPARIVADLTDLADALAQENDKLREALDPNHTQAGYIGEFEQLVYFGIDDDGDEVWQDVRISWDVIKQIMAAIRARAALGDRP